MYNYGGRMHGTKLVEIEFKWRLIYDHREIKDSIAIVDAILSWCIASATRIFFSLVYTLGIFKNNFKLKMFGPKRNESFLFR